MMPDELAWQKKLKPHLLAIYWQREPALVPLCHPDLIHTMLVSRWDQETLLMKHLKKGADFVES